jgi:CheY-like chemotaxis protein
MKPTVLIAEGDDELRYSLACFFGAHGYEAATAAGGLECVRQLRQRRPLACVLDQELRWGGSAGVLAVMRDDPDLRHIPVILTSARGPWVPWSDGWEPPVVQALGKPYLWTDLLDWIDGAATREASHERCGAAPEV